MSCSCSAELACHVRWDTGKWGIKGQSPARDVKLNACVKYSDLSMVGSRGLMEAAVSVPWKLSGINEHEIDGASHAGRSL